MNAHRVPLMDLAFECMHIQESATPVGRHGTPTLLNQSSNTYSIFTPYGGYLIVVDGSIARVVEHYTQLEGTYWTTMTIPILYRALESLQVELLRISQDIFQYLDGKWYHSTQVPTPTVR